MVPQKVETYSSHPIVSHRSLSQDSHQLTPHHQLLIGKTPFDARPERVGPGMWISLHILARVVDTMPLANQSSGRAMFVDFVVRGIGQHMPCLDCRKHALEYATRIDPVRSLLNVDRKIQAKIVPQHVDSCLAWSHRFHDTVNERLKRSMSQRPSLVDLEEFLTSLEAGRGCSDCGPLGSETETVSLPTLTPLQPRLIRRQLLD